jgi:hypothetical protein
MFFATRYKGLHCGVSFGDLHFARAFWARPLIENGRKLHLSCLTPLGLRYNTTIAFCGKVRNGSYRWESSPAGILCHRGLVDLSSRTVGDLLEPHRWQLPANGVFYHVLP